MLGFIKVESSTIESVKHDELVNELLIIFKSGGMYKYSDVSSKEYTLMIEAESIGKHFNKFIKPSKLFEKF